MNYPRNQEFFHHFWKKLTSFLMLCFFIATLPAQAQQLLQKKVQLKQSDNSLLEIIQELEQTHGITFSYDESALPKVRLKLDKKYWQLKELLKAIEGQVAVEFRYLNGQIILRKKKKTKVNFSGTIKVDGEQIPGATVYVPELNIGSATDANGYYSLLLPPGRYTSVFSFIGHQQENRPLNLDQDTSLDVNLYPSVDPLEQVVISASQSKTIDLLQTMHTGQHQVDVQQISRMPMLGGETDILRGMQTLPGIQNATPGTINFSARGGAYDQNLVLLDGIPIYNTAHSLGFFSFINPDAIDQVTLYKGHIPAKYGGRLSSITNMQTSNDEVEKFSLKGGIGLLSSRLAIHTPLGKRVSLRVAGRISTSGIINLFPQPTPDINTPPVNRIHNTVSDYTDLVASILVKPTEKDRVKLTSILSRDTFEGADVILGQTFNWQSKGFALNWQRKFSSSLQGDFNLHYSRLDQGYAFDDLTRDYNIGYQWQAGIEQMGGKMNFGYLFSPQSELAFGADFTKHHFRPGKTQESIGIVDVSLADRHSLESGLYVIHRLDLTPKLKVNYGARVSGFYNIGGVRYVYDEAQNLIESQNFAVGKWMDAFIGFEPHFSLRYRFNHQTAVKFSYSRHYQYLHQVNNSAVQLPTNIWLPANNNLKPRFVDQLSLGYFQKLDKKERFEFSAEVYARWMHRVTDFRDNADVVLNDRLATEVSTGTGQALGLELMFRKKGKKLNGTLSYTLSKVVFRIPGIHQGASYAPRYDRPHNLSLNLSYELGRRWRIASNFTYMSGALTTLPQGWFVLNNRLYNYFTKRNDFRLPHFMQWDLNFTLKSKQRRRWQGEWSFGVTNVLNRRNPLAVFRDQSRHNPVKGNRFVNLYLTGWVPYVSYQFKF